jgi:hypothetical protein
MSVLSIFCIGTGHTIEEQNNTVAKLGREVRGRSLILSGVGRRKSAFINQGVLLAKLGPLSALADPLGNFAGQGMDARAREALDAVIECRPQTVNLVGHSRGAIICHLIANDIAGSDHPACQAVREINIFAIDPVNMAPGKGKRAKHLRQAVRLGTYVGVIMENEKSGLFPPTLIKYDLATQAAREKLIFYNLPGTHGSGTQPLTSAIGHACYQMAQRFLNLWGTELTRDPPTAVDICTAFARIILESPTLLDEAGNIASRTTTDDATGNATSKQDPKIAQKQSAVSAARTGAFSKVLRRMHKAGVDAFDHRNTGLFLNDYHARCFHTAFPQTYGYLASGGNRPEAELQVMAGRYPEVRVSLAKLGI